MRNLPFAREVSYSFLHRDIDVTPAAKPVCAILLIHANKLMRSSGVFGQFPLMSKLTIGQIVLWNRIFRLLEDKLHEWEVKRSAEGSPRANVK